MKNDQQKIGRQFCLLYKGCEWRKKTAKTGGCSSCSFGGVMKRAYEAGYARGQKLGYKEGYAERGKRCNCIKTV